MTRRFPSRTGPEPAFTLLELLVVIVIVALLGAIGMPVYHKITESAYASKDVSNLRQLGIAMNLYVDDNGCFPGEQWPASLNPRYVASWDVFHSPFDNRRVKQEDKDQTAPVSYDLNANLWGLTMFQMVSPANCVLLAPLTADSSSPQFMSTAIEPGLPAPLNKESNGLGSTGGTYSSGKYITVLFGDLHAAALSMQDFHSSVPNPDTTSSITDIRWNE